MAHCSRFSSPMSSLKSSTKVKNSFKSPLLKKDNIPNLSLEDEIEKLKSQEIGIQDQIDALQKDGYDLKELDIHIDKLHKYNETKDIGQFLLGQLANLKGVTTVQLYEDFDLNVSD